MSPSSSRVLAAVLALAAATLLAPRTASAGEVQLASGPGVYGSSWRGDSTFGQALRVGYRFGDLFAVDTVGRLGYGSVDDRVITYLSLGGTLYGRIWKLRPYVRLAFVHQHEEPTPGVRDDPFGAVFGVGDGIRHRGGFGSSLGIDYPVLRKNQTEMTLGVDTSGVWFPDPRGPTLYAGGSLWLGVNFGILIMWKLHVVLGLLLLAGCKAETSIDDYPCPTGGTKLTYESFGSAFLADNCQTCHGKDSGDWKGAPSGFDFGTVEQVRAQKARIFARAAADNVTMPPGPDDPPAAARHELAEWLACGAP